MSDLASSFAKLLTNNRRSRYVLRLYVTGQTHHSIRAIANVKALCDAYLKDRYELSIIDLYDEPARAGLDQIVAAPTLVKMLPLPLRRLIGDLSDPQRVLMTFEIRDEPE